MQRKLPSSRSIRFAVLPLALALCANAQSPAAPPDAAASTAPTLRVFSRETIVDVMVTNENGDPVHNLKQSDFTISEDGHPQPIRSFAEFGAHYTPPSPQPHRPPYVYTNFQATPANGPVNILLFDAINSDQPAIVHALQDAQRYVVAMPAGTQVAIFWLSISGLHMLQGFTSDPALLLRALRTTRTDIGNNGDDKYSVDRLIWTSLDQIAAYVSPIKGRKNLLWFTPGMPLMLSRDGGYAFPDKMVPGRLFGGDPNAPDMTRVHHLMDTYEFFASQQIAVSPVDPRGVVGVGWAQLKAEQVAEDTGGEAFYNNNDLEVLIAKAISDGSNFYTISYIPPRQKEDGHYHSIKVETTNPRLHLVYRAGYNSEDPPQAPHHTGVDLMHAALEGKAPAVTQLIFDAEVSPSAAPAKTSQPVGLQTSKPSVPYDVFFALSPSEIAFTPGPDGTRSGSLQFGIVAFDMFGRPVATQSQTMPLPLSAGEYREFLKTPFKLSQTINLPPGEISLRIGVIDTTSNKVGTLEIPIYVPGKLIKHPPPPTVAPTGCPPRCPLPISTEVEIPW
jgi:VWFA-related protein